MGFGTSTTSTPGRQRAVARAVLALLVGLLATFMALSGGSFNPLAFAQQSPSPGPQIEFLNPASSTSTEISTKSDGVDSFYHIVATVQEVPQNAIVEFKYQADNANVEQNLGQATRVRDTDTFELFDDFANINDGGGTLRAILFSGAQEVDRDEQAVTINNAGAENFPGDPSAQSETVEITAPANAGSAGFFTGPDGITNIVVDVSFSAQTRFVRAFFTTSAPGAPPSFTRCGQESASAAGDGVRCNLPSGTNPSSVTGLAAVANDTPLGSTPQDEFDESGDGHRVFGFTAVPSTVTLTPQTHTVNPDAEGDFPCSQVITGTVFDQSGRKIAGANADVHAAGPTDDLFFDDRDSSGDNTSPGKAPDQGGHSTESTVNCEAGGSPPPFNTSGDTQGEHEVPGEGDIKHIESTAGTNDAGQFTFQLNNRTRGATGGTQISMWADTDGDDLKCAEEADGDGSIGWGTAAPSPTGLPDERQTCPAASPSPTPTGSPSPTPTETESPSPTPTEEECPEGATCGSDGPDNIEGTEGDDVIFGRGGDDTIDGKSGDDVIFGEEGDDVIMGGSGRDDLRGGSGDDSVTGERGHDSLRGGGGTDTLTGNRGRDNVRGGGGTDSLRGGAFADILIGGKRGDVLVGGGGRDNLRGRRGNDIIRGRGGNDALRGDPGNDTLNGGSGVDTCRGGRGRDRARNCER